MRNCWKYTQRYGSATWYSKCKSRRYVDDNGDVEMLKSGVLLLKTFKHTTDFNVILGIHRAYVCSLIWLKWFGNEESCSDIRACIRIMWNAKIFLKFENLLTEHFHIYIHPPPSFISAIAGCSAKPSQSKPKWFESMWMSYVCIYMHIYIMALRFNWKMC